MKSSARVRVLLVEDNYLTRLGTATLIGSRADMEIVGEAEDGPQGVTRYRELRPDVAVVDMRLPTLDGPSVTAEIRREDPQARVLILSHHSSEEDVFLALKAGARGYVTKEGRGEELVSAIQTVAAGGRYLPSELAGRLAARAVQAELTAREREVLELVYKGLSNREIATELAISTKTTSFYVSAVLDKLGAKSRTEAVAIALQRGLLR